MDNVRGLVGAGLLACSAAAGDEIVTTFGNDWFFTLGWETVGQTVTVPTSNVLDSLAVVIKGGSESPFPFFIYVFEWDEGDVVGAALWSELAWGQGTQEEIFAFDEIGLHLAREGQYAILVTLLAGDVLPGVAFVQDAYAGGTLLTKEAFDTPMIAWVGNDMLFSAGFTSCTADINGDGELNIFDFISFQGVFTSGDMAADCNQDGVLNVLDFVCFQSKFLAGCG
jgi:hypothetical protein